MLAEVGRRVDAEARDDFDLVSIEAVFAALAPFGERWFPLHHEFTLLAVRDAEARDRFLAHVAQFEGRIQELFARVLDLLGRDPVTDVQDQRGPDGALPPQPRAELLGTGGLPPDRLVAEVLPHVLIGLSTPGD